MSRPLALGAALVRLHDRFREDLAGIRGDVERVLAGDRAAVPARDLETHCLAFCSRLHDHHGEEDTVLFPHLAREHPELVDVLGRLGREHRAVARGLDALRDALTRFAATEDRSRRAGCGTRWCASRTGWKRTWTARRRSSCRCSTR